MEIGFRVSFFVLKDGDRNQFCERNYRLREYTDNDDLYILAHKRFDRLMRQYNLDDLTERGFACKTQTPSGRFELVPPGYYHLNFVEFVRRFEVNSRFEVEGGRIIRRLVVGAELYFVEKAIMGLRVQHDFPNPAHR